MMFIKIGGIDMTKISPSVLAADILYLEDDVARIVDAGVDYLHVDVMDGVFVPNISYGPAIVEALDSAFATPLDVHLMIQKPMQYIKTFADAGADIITVHVEAEGFEDMLKLMDEIGVKKGASLKPKTDVSSLYPYLDRLDLILVMTVEPGFGGQKFMGDMMPKIKALRDKGFKGIISVDGGINANTGKIALDAGADMLVMGTALFKADDPYDVIDEVMNY